MSMWDAHRQKTKGEVSLAPTCSNCGRTSVLDPCRLCATPKQLERYPDEPREYSLDESDLG